MRAALTETDESMLKGWLNFAVTNRGPNLDMAYVAETARFKIPPPLGYGVLLEDLMYLGEIKNFDM
jgi:hypothetical protein